MDIREQPFGVFDNKPVTEYILARENMEVGIINYGGAITKILVPDKSGSIGDVVTGFESLNGFLQRDNPYFGALIGRYANRIANARFILNEREYQLVQNDGRNNLHGGNKGYDKIYWNAEKQSGTGIKLTYLSKDGEEGYPGNLNITVLYNLLPDHSLKIDYMAITDKPTPINLTSHCYFNLSAGKEDTILKHQLEIVANHYLPVDDELIPTGIIAPVKNTDMDFTTLKSIGENIGSKKNGYDHTWVLKKRGTALQKAAGLYEPVSGRMMEVFTTAPGLQFYSGNFLGVHLLHTKNGIPYTRYAALCLEAQSFPNSPNESFFPNTILRPGEVYRQTTMYKFSIR